MTIERSVSKEECTENPIYIFPTNYVM